MRTLKFLLLFLLIGIIPALAAPNRVEIKQLTVSGIPVTGDSLSNGQQLVSDSIYQMGNNGFLSVATQVSGNVSLSYQVSYDNINWWTPNTSSSGTLTSIGTIATSLTSNTWVISQAVMAPYMRFIYTSTGSSVITADALWQDQS